MKWPFVSRRHYDLLEHNYGKLRDEVLDARRDSEYSYARLDELLSENKQVLTLLAGERERNEMMTTCVIDTLREALGVEPPKAQQAADNQAAAFEPEVPKEVQAAIDATFPGDSVIRAANVHYAYSQSHRWNTESLELADEIRQGERV